MREVKRFVADDGSEWQYPDDAKARDGLIREVSDIMSKLPEPPENALRGGGAYFQHSPADVLAAQSALARAYLKRWKDCNGHIEWVVNATVPAGDTFFGRILSDSNTAGPINTAWCRICRIDSQFREWEQPYYTRNPNLSAKRLGVNGSEAL